MATERVGYYTPDVAKYVLESVRYLMTLAKDKKVRPAAPYDGWICKTDSGGVAARSGTTVGTGTVVPYCINSSNVLTELKKSDDTSRSLTAYNLSAEAVAGDTWIQCKQVGGKLIVDVEYCDQV